MLSARPIRIAALAVLGLLFGLWVGASAGQGLKEDAAAALEVRVLDVQGEAGQGDRSGKVYRMEVISVLRSSVKLKPGDTIVVRSAASVEDMPSAGMDEPAAPAFLAPGWLGIAYLSPDPQAQGPDARLQFVAPANDASFEDRPPSPPSLKWTRPPEGRGN